MDQIRVIYSGVIAFITRFLSFITGIAFLVIVTHNLSERDFGIWQVLQNSQNYSLFFLPVITFWTIRYIARGTEVGRTSLFLALILSVPALSLYLISSLFFTSSLNVSLLYFAIGSLQVPLYYLIGTLEALSQGSKPQLLSYAFILAEIAKLTIAFILISVVNLQLEHVIIVIIIAQLTQLFILLFLMKDQLRMHFDTTIARHWLKMAWFPLFAALPTLIFSLDTFVVSYFTRSAEAIAFYKAAYILANLLTYSQYLSLALYPHLLKGNNSSMSVESTLKLLLMIIIPLAVGTYVMAEPLLHLLKPTYTSSITALQFLIPFIVMTVMYSFVDAIFSGLDHTETNGSNTIRKLLSSKISLIPKIGIAYYISYLGTLTAAMYFVSVNKFSYNTIATIWAVVNLIVIVPFIIYKWQLARSFLSFRIPWMNIIRYLSSAASMAIITIYMNSLLDFRMSTINIALNIMLEVFCASCAYFLTLFLLDKEFQIIISSAIRTKFNYRAKN